MTQQAEVVAAGSDARSSAASRVSRSGPAHAQIGEFGLADVDKSHGWRVMHLEK
jgi:hypothetical protein